MWLWNIDVYKLYGNINTWKYAFPEILKQIGLEMTREEVFT